VQAARPFGPDPVRLHPVLHVPEHERGAHHFLVGFAELSPPALERLQLALAQDRAT
jgi:hypothetical protein